MAQTAGGTYYAASSELVSSWPATSLDLANQLESRFAAKLGTLSVNAQTGTTYTLTTSDPQKVITMTNAAASSVTIPTNTTAAIAIGSAVEIVNLSTGVNTTISAAGGVTFNGGPVVLSPGSSVTVVKIGTNAWMAQGQGSPGLVHIASSTFSAVSSFSINNCFTSTYDNYRIVGEFTGNTALGLNGRLRLAGSDASGSNYDVNDLTMGASTVVDTQTNNTTSVNVGAGNTGRRSGFVLDVFSPAIAQETTFIGLRSYPLDDIRGNVQFANHNLATAYDGITVFPNTGNVSGTIRIYGYRN